jgi:hypothetical protein
MEAKKLSRRCPPVGVPPEEAESTARTRRQNLNISLLFNNIHHFRGAKMIKMGL